MEEKGALALNHVHKSKGNRGIRLFGFENEGFTE